MPTRVMGEGQNAFGQMYSRAKSLDLGVVCQLRPCGGPKNNKTHWNVVKRESGCVVAVTTAAARSDLRAQSMILKYSPR
jgi:hypothetical protein